MKRLSASARVPMMRSPLVMSAARSAGGGSRVTSFSSEPAIDLIGASELFSSWPITRISRCHAASSSARSARLTSESTTSVSGRPSWRKAPRRSSNRPEPPGSASAGVPDAGPSRHTARPSSSAKRPSTARPVAPRSCSPARLTRRSARRSSNAKTATSISAITLRSRAVASTSPSRCSRRPWASWLSSITSSPKASSRRPPRTRNEKSPSRTAASRLVIVRSQNATRCRTRPAPISHAATTTAPAAARRPPLPSARSEERKRERHRRYAAGECRQEQAPLLPHPAHSLCFSIRR